MYQNNKNVNNDELYINIGGIEEESVVDGEGVRFTIFVQGCHHNCKGCHNPSTHDVNGGKKYSTNEIKEKIEANIGLINGITISGGEPFLQSTACLELVKIANSLNLTTWVYTGYTFEELMKSKNSDQLEFLRKIDVLVDGRYIEDKRDLSLNYRGSSNQRLIDIQKTFDMDNPSKTPILYNIDI